MADDALLTLAVEVGAALKARGWMLALAESCTGGGAAQAATSVAGSSDWFDRGFVTYSNAAKIEMLGVPANAIEQYGAVSEQVAREMVLGTLRHSRARVAASSTGIAGPGGGSADKPVGMVCFAWATADGVLVSQTCRFEGDRAAVRRQAVATLLQGVVKWAGDGAV
jgi:nicotinamide-nucleotide amidase